MLKLFTDFNDKPSVDNIQRESLKSVESVETSRDEFVESDIPAEPTITEESENTIQTVILPNDNELIERSNKNVTAVNESVADTGSTETLPPTKSIKISEDPPVKPDSEKSYGGNTTLMNDKRHHESQQNDEKFTEPIEALESDLPKLVDDLKPLIENELLNGDVHENVTNNRNNEETLERPPSQSAPSNATSEYVFIVKESTVVDTVTAVKAATENFNDAKSTTTTKAGSPEKSKKSAINEDVTTAAISTETLPSIKSILKSKLKTLDDQFVRTDSEKSDGGNTTPMIDKQHQDSQQVDEEFTEPQDVTESNRPILADDIMSPIENELLNEEVHENDTNIRNDEEQLERLPSQLSPSKVTSSNVFAINESTVVDSLEILPSTKSVDILSNVKSPVGVIDSLYSTNKISADRPVKPVSENFNDVNSTKADSPERSNAVNEDVTAVNESTTSTETLPSIKSIKIAVDSLMSKLKIPDSEKSDGATHMVDKQESHQNDEEIPEPQEVTESDRPMLADDKMPPIENEPLNEDLREIATYDIKNEEQPERSRSQSHPSKSAALPLAL